MRKAPRSFAQAGDNHTENGTATRDAKEDKADHVVDIHELSRLELVVIGGVILGSFNTDHLIFIERVARGELAS